MKKPTKSVHPAKTPIPARTVQLSGLLALLRPFRAIVSVSVALGMASLHAMAASSDDFVDAAAESGIAEVVTSNLALEKTQSADIKTFAQQMVNARVFVVDDDASVRDALGWLLRTRRLLSVPYESADQFWAEAAQWHSLPSPGCLLLDVRMPGQSGLALFESLIGNGLAQTWPVIFLSGHADVPTAVDSVKRGAFDFCEKPFSDNALVDRYV